jgi:hypothetical protein
LHVSLSHWPGSGWASPCLFSADFSAPHPTAQIASLDIENRLGFLIFLLLIFKRRGKSK